MRVSEHTCLIRIEVDKQDFDGDQMFFYILSDLESKAKAYGSFGHHSMLDENTPFTISRFANQTSTNLMNINNIMRGTPIK